MSTNSFTVIGELINNSFARSRRAFEAKDMAKYQELARLQTEQGAHYLDLNVDATQKISVELDEMLAILPDLIPAIQEVSDLPICFDNPEFKFHEKALSIYTRNENNKPILNSIAASREDLDEMLAIIKEYDTKVLVMASEKFVASGRATACRTGEEVYETTKIFVQRLKEEAHREMDDIIIDPGLAPLAADTYGLVNMALDSMRLIRADSSLDGVHISVGLTNFSFGVPKHIRAKLERAFLTLAGDAGMDYVLGNSERDLYPLAADDSFLAIVKEVLEAGRPKEGESQVEAGNRQTEKIMELYMC